MIARLIIVAALQCFIGSSLADGVFVFRWNKKADINEPAQKAIVLHDARRQDLLLQVRYEGPADEFGWLIPVPSVPTVERGSMEAFYELSLLTQQRFGDGSTRIATLGMATAGAAKPEPVKVIETKTVGAYKIAVLSAEDAGSLDRWLKENQFAIPGAQQGLDVVNDYIRRGWFFVAVKINVAAAARPSAHKAIQTKLHAGELHPLLISFDTPKCVFPLKISSVAGKASEVSLYVLSAQPLLNRRLFDERCAMALKEVADAAAREQNRLQEQKETEERFAIMSRQRMLLNEENRSGATTGTNSPRALTEEELQALRAMTAETKPRAPEPAIEDKWPSASSELVSSMPVTPAQIAKAAKSIPRLKGKPWFLTKETRSFLPSEMIDLEFEPAIPALAAMLPTPVGATAGHHLATLGAEGVAALIAACANSEATVRKHAARSLIFVRDDRAVNALLPLLSDPVPAIRLMAVRAAEKNWTSRLIDPMFALFSDAYPEIRSEAAGCLLDHAPAESASRCAGLINDTNPKVRLSGIGLLASAKPDLVRNETLLEWLRDADPDVQHTALQAIVKSQRSAGFSRADLLDVLSSRRMDNVLLALSLINRMSLAGANPTTAEERDFTHSLSSSEAAPLAASQFAMARLLSFRVFKRDADEKAIELTLPLLRDSNPIVRARAFAVMKAITGKDISSTDAKAWSDWWAASRTSRQK